MDPASYLFISLDQQTGTNKPLKWVKIGSGTTHEISRLLFKLRRIRRLQKQPIEILVSKFRKTEKTWPIFRALATSNATSMF